MNARRNVFVCLECDTAVFQRHKGDGKGCECGKCYFHKNHFMVVTAGDPTQGVDFEYYEDVPLRQTEEILLNDFVECHDRFGSFKNATKVIAKLYETSGAPGVYQPRRYFEELEVVLDEIYDNGVTESMALKENAFITIKKEALQDQENQ